GRLPDLPVLDGDGRDYCFRLDAKPHTSRRVGRAEGGAPARAHAARDAAVDDPPPQHAHAARGRRHDPLPRARLLPRLGDGRAARGFHRRARARPARPRACACASLGTDVTVESGRLPSDSLRRMFDRIAPVYDTMNWVMTAGLDRRWRKATIQATVHPG